MIAWLTSLFGRGQLMIGLLTFAAVVFGLVRRDASKDRDRDAQIKELHDAQDIRNRVDRADRAHRDGLRPFRDAGWRDGDPDG